jgi:hypothetical protein
MGRIGRREFVAGSAGFWIAASAARAESRSPNEKLNIAMIACGGRGGSNLGDVSSENIVVLCDINEQSLDKAGQRFPQAKKYTDFRKVYDDAKSFDAVVVSTPEHTHAFATMPAIQLGKHVYCEKPMTHGIWEARVITEAAAKAKIATQMGTQLHASENYRRVVELIQAGAIGAVSEVHVWVNRAWGWQSPEDAKKHDIISTQERPAETHPVPAHIHWDLFLGPAPERPFHQEVYLPGPRWYRWWDFASGTMSDLGSHYNDLPFWALGLKHPLTIEASGPPPHAELAPASFRATYEYGPRGEMPACKLTWYQGTEKPPQYSDGTIPRGARDGKKKKDWSSGFLFIGSKGMLLADYGDHMLLPEERFAGFQRPAPSIPKSLGHHKEWIHAAKTGAPTLSNFGYAGPLTEANHLASIAFRMGKKLEWDPVAMRAKNCPEADRLIHREYRKGWSLA